MFSLNLLDEVIIIIHFMETDLDIQAVALHLTADSQTAQWVKNLPALQETWVPSLGQEDPLEEGTAIHSSILAWEFPWTEEPGRLQVYRVANSRT